MKAPESRFEDIYTDIFLLLFISYHPIFFLVSIYDPWKAGSFFLSALSIYILPTWE